jgi:hypothetical protein
MKQLFKHAIRTHKITLVLFWISYNIISFGLSLFLLVFGNYNWTHLASLIKSGNFSFLEPLLIFPLLFQLIICIFGLFEFTLCAPKTAQGTINFYPATFISLVFLPQSLLIIYQFVYSILSMRCPDFMLIFSVSNVIYIIGLIVFFKKSVDYNISASNPLSVTNLAKDWRVFIVLIEFIIIAISGIIIFVSIQCGCLYRSCNIVLNQEIKAQCYSNLSACDEVHNQDTKDLCYVYMAKLKADDSLCNKILDKNSKDECYWQVGVRTRNISICEKIQNLSERKNCIRETQTLYY